MVLGCGVVVVCARDVVKLRSECDKLIEPAGSWDDEWCRIQNDAVRYADFHCVLDEAAVRTIVLQGWSKVKPDKSPKLSQVSRTEL